MGVEVGSLLVTLNAPTSTSACAGISLVQCNLSVTTMSFGGLVSSNACTSGDAG